MQPRLPRLTFLKQQGFLYFPMTQRGNLSEPSPLQQRAKVNRSLFCLHPWNCFVARELSAWNWKCLAKVSIRKRWRPRRRSQLDSTCPKPACGIKGQFHPYYRCPSTHTGPAVGRFLGGLGWWHSCLRSHSHQNSRKIWFCGEAWMLPANRLRTQIVHGQDAGDPRSLRHSPWWDP